LTVVTPENVRPGRDAERESRRQDQA